MEPAFWVQYAGYVSTIFVTLVSIPAGLRKLDQIPLRLFVPMVAFGLLLLISTATAVGGVSYAKLWGYVGFMFAFVLGCALPARPIQNVLRGVVICVAIIVSIDALRSWGRPELLANPNVLGSWMLFTWPVSWISLLPLALSQSRGAIVGLGLAALAYAWRYENLRMYLAAGLVVATAAAVAWRPATLDKRLDTWRTSVQLFLERPLTGWGAGRFSHLRNPNPTSHAENAPLTIAVEMGVVGLAGYGWLAWRIAQAAWRSPSIWKWAWLAVGLHQLVDDTLFWPWTALLAGLTLAWMVTDELEFGH
jgi:hypothetical protein